MVHLGKTQPTPKHRHTHMHTAVLCFPAHQLPNCSFPTAPCSHCEAGQARTKHCKATAHTKVHSRVRHPKHIRGGAGRKREWSASKLTIALQLGIPSCQSKNVPHPIVGGEVQEDVRDSLAPINCAPSSPHHLFTYKHHISTTSIAVLRILPKCSPSTLSVILIN